MSTNLKVHVFPSIDPNLSCRVYAWQDHGECAQRCERDDSLDSPASPPKAEKISMSVIGGENIK